MTKEKIQTQEEEQQHTNLEDQSSSDLAFYNKLDYNIRLKFEEIMSYFDKKKNEILSLLDKYVYMFNEGKFNNLILSDLSFKKPIFVLTNTNTDALFKPDPTVVFKIIIPKSNKEWQKVVEFLNVFTPGFLTSKPPGFPILIRLKVLDKLIRATNNFSEILLTDETPDNFSLVFCDIAVIKDGKVIPAYQGTHPSNWEKTKKHRLVSITLTEFYFHYVLNVYFYFMLKFVKNKANLNHIEYPLDDFNSFLKTIEEIHKNNKDNKIFPIIIDKDVFNSAFDTNIKKNKRIGLIIGSDLFQPSWYKKLVKDFKQNILSHKVMLFESTNKILQGGIKVLYWLELEHAYVLSIRPYFKILIDKNTK